MPFGTPGSCVVTPYLALDGLTSASTDRGTCNRSHIASLHCIVRMSNNIVRLALLGSVTKAAPCVRFHTIQESMVPMQRCSAGGVSTLCKSHAALVPEKYGSRTRPVVDLTWSRCGSSSVQRCAVRLSCHTIARAHGWPFLLSHATTVSR